MTAKALEDLVVELAQRVERLEALLGADATELPQTDAESMPALERQYRAGRNREKERS